jgi:hypothetical protein
MGDTVEAIGYKTDVKSRAKESVQDKVSGVRDRITGVKGSAPSTGDVKQGAKQVVGVAEANPLGLGVAALAGGFLLGMLVPATRIENEKIGPVSTEVKQHAKETAQEAVEHGKEVVQEVASSAAQTAQEQGRQHAEELKDSAQENAQQAAQDARA